MLVHNLSKSEKRIIASGLIGNLLENFDLMICAFLAPILAQTFLPPNSGINNLFLILILFFISHLSRPIGSFILGLLADQIGRKKLLIFTMVLVGISTTAIGLIPSYSTLGVLSTALFFLCRFLQGSGMGGEYISSISYMIENAREKRKGYFGSWVSVGFNAGTLIACALVLSILSLVEHNLLPSWSWRLAFVPALFTMCVGLWIRSNLPESLEFILANANTETASKKTIFYNSIRVIQEDPYKILMIMAIAWLGVSETAAIYFYSPIHLTTINNYSLLSATVINMISLILLVPLIPWFGHLSDKYDPVKLLIGASIGFALLALPYFWCLSYGTYSQIVTLKLLFSIPSACYYAIAPTLITMNFPVKVRCTSLALIYQTTLAFAVGLTPIIMLALAKEKPISAAYFLMLSTLIGLIGLYALFSQRRKAIKNETLLSQVT